MKIALNLRKILIYFLPDGNPLGGGAFPEAEGAERHAVLNIEKAGPLLLRCEGVQVAPLGCFPPVYRKRKVTTSFNFRNAYSTGTGTLLS
jgi:hypothetical protein